MKLSRTIGLVLFTGSSLGMFYYALKRTDGNISKSIIFTFYIVAIKIGLIAPNVPAKLDQN